MLLNLIASALHPGPSPEFVQRVIWTISFAAQLVLLVVLFGRDRARRFPWFTTAVAAYALQMLMEELLAGRMAPLPLNEILIALACVEAILSLLVLIELARQAFAGLSRPLWIVNTAGVLALAGGVLYVWGPWPARQEIVLDSLMGKLRLLQLIGQKGGLLVAMLTVALGLLVVLLGPRYKAALGSHVQKIVIGLMTASIALLARQVFFIHIQAAVQQIVRAPQSNARQEYDRLIAQAGDLMNIHNIIYIVVLIWWIVWLWRDEPGTIAAPEAADGQIDTTVKVSSSEEEK